MDSPGENEKKVNAILTAWEAHAKDVKFAGLTLAQFKAKVQLSLDTRDDIKVKEQELEDLADNRDDADKVSMPLCDQVVKSVVGDVNFGDDSTLYAAMGYKRKSERKTGLTRKKKPAGDAKG